MPNVSLTDRMMVKTIEWNRGEDHWRLSRFIASRGMGSAGVAGASLIDAVHEAGLGALSGLNTVYQLCSNRAQHKRFTTLLGSPHSSSKAAARKTWTHLKCAAIHLVVIPTALIAGAIAPVELLLPAMNKLGMAANLGPGGNLLQRIKTVARVHRTKMMLAFVAIATTVVTYRSYFAIVIPGSNFVRNLCLLTTGAAGLAGLTYYRSQRIQKRFAQFDRILAERSECIDNPNCGYSLHRFFDSFVAEFHSMRSFIARLPQPDRNRASELFETKLQPLAKKLDSKKQEVLADHSVFQIVWKATCESDLCLGELKEPEHELYGSILTIMMGLLLWGPEDQKLSSQFRLILEKAGRTEALIDGEPNFKALYEALSGKNWPTKIASTPLQDHQDAKVIVEHYIEMLATNDKFVPYVNIVRYLKQMDAAIEQLRGDPKTIATQEKANLLRKLASLVPIHSLFQDVNYEPWTCTQLLEGGGQLQIEYNNRMYLIMPNIIRVLSKTMAKIIWCNQTDNEMNAGLSIMWKSWLKIPETVRRDYIDLTPLYDETRRAIDAARPRQIAHRP